MEKERPAKPMQTEEQKSEEQSFASIRKGAKKDYIIACLAGGVSLIAVLGADVEAVHNNMPTALVDGVLSLGAAGVGLYNRRVANDGFQRALMLEQANEYRDIIDAASNMFGEDLNEAAYTIGDATRAQKIGGSMPPETTVN